MATACPLCMLRNRDPSQIQKQSLSPLTVTPCWRLAHGDHQCQSAGGRTGQRSFFQHNVNISSYASQQVTVWKSTIGNMLNKHQDERWMPCCQDMCSLQLKNSDTL